MNVIDHIKAVIDDYLNENDLFLVEVNFSDSKPKKKIEIFADGISSRILIDQCASISRILSKSLEENENLVEGAFLLEVSSPGMDQPFRHDRQYTKHVGREVKVITKQGQDIQGVLKNANDDFITLEVSKKKSDIEEVKIEKKEINKTKLVIAF